MTDTDMIMGQLKLITERLDKMDGRFDRMDERFDRMDARMDKMDERFDRIDGRMDKMDERFDRMDARMDKMDERIDRIDGRIDKIDGRIDQIDGRIDKIDDRIDNVEGSIQSLRTELTRRMDDMETALDTEINKVYLMAVKNSEDIQLLLPYKDKILNVSASVDKIDELERHQKVTDEVVANHSEQLRKFKLIKK